MSVDIVPGTVERARVESPERRTQRISTGVLITVIGVLLLWMAFTVDKSGQIALSDAFADVTLPTLDVPGTATVLLSALLVLGALLGVAIFGGMFVVPLYAFLTTTVTKDHTARTVAANNVVNAGAMTVGSLGVAGLVGLGVTPSQLLLLVAAMCVVSAWIALKLHRACD